MTKIEKKIIEDVYHTIVNYLNDITVSIHPQILKDKQYLEQKEQARRELNKAFDDWLKEGDK